MNTLWLSGALGGGLILGSAATLFLLLNGRMTGISGILADLWADRYGDFLWRALFVLGLLSGGWLLLQTGPEVIGEPLAQRSPGTLAIAGFLVGLGARLSHGCTSGHGICGLGRHSSRSLAATLIFMGSGMLTVYVLDHLLA